MIDLKAGAGVLAGMLAVGLLAGCASTQERATMMAAELARQDANRLRTQIANLFHGTQDKTGVYRDALRYHYLPPEDRSGSAALLGSSLTEKQAQFDITVVHMADAGGGLDKAQATVRLCAHIVVRFYTHPTSDEISNLDCPADLPNHVDGYGDIDKIVPYKK